jgi:hypothetical protein
MLGRFKCPSCGEHGGILAEDGSGVPRCPRCGQRLLIEPLAAEEPPIESRAIDDAVVSWVSQVSKAHPVKRDEVATCNSCGFEGLMEYDSDRGDKICPACLSVFRSKPALSRHALECPNCHEPIEVYERDRGKTIVCAACNYFVGCVLRSEKRRFGTFQFLNSVFDAANKGRPC